MTRAPETEEPGRIIERLDQQAEKTLSSAKTPAGELDWTERWGRRLGRLLGIALAAYLLWHLLSTYALKQ